MEDPALDAVINSVTDLRVQIHRDEDGDVVLTRDEILAIVDSGARRTLGISGREMAVAYRRGTLEDISGVIDLVVLLDLLPEDDPIFGGV